MTYIRSSRDAHVAASLLAAAAPHEDECTIEAVLPYSSVLS